MNEAVPRLPSRLDALPSTVRLSLSEALSRHAAEQVTLTVRPLRSSVRMCWAQMRATVAVSLASACTSCTEGGGCGTHDVHGGGGGGEVDTALISAPEVV